MQLETPAPGARLQADENGFDEALGLWLEQRRQSDHRAQLQPLQDARDSAEASGDFDRALHCAQELVALEPLQELHHAALMRLHYLRGEPAAGLVVYQRQSDALQAGVGSRPAAATQDLAGALRRMGRCPPPPPHRTHWRAACL